MGSWRSHGRELAHVLWEQPHDRGACVCLCCSLAFQRWRLTRPHNAWQYLIDMSNPVHVSSGIVELLKVLAHDKTAGTPVLILLNKWCANTGCAQCV